MGQVIAIVIIVVFLALMFIPMALLSNSQYQVGEIKASLNLSAKALINGIERDLVNVEGISEGYSRNPQQEMIINKEKLLEDFYDVLYKNYYDEKIFREIKSRLVLKILVMKDRFYVADLQNQWSPPYFFTHKDLEKILYLSVGYNDVYHYNDSGEKIYQPMGTYAITPETKNQMIIDKINSVVAMETASYSKEGQLALEIQNPDRKDGDYKRRYQNFNVLEGVTFFVIYQENSEIQIDGKKLDFRNYNVVGYTLKQAGALNSIE